MIYTVTFSPSLDYHMTVNSAVCADIPARAESTCFKAGGKGINVSGVLSSLGEDNTALCFLGGDTGKMLESMLISKGQKYECIEVPSPTRVNVKIAELTEDQKTFEFNAKGGKISKEHVDLLLSSLEKLTENDIVILSGSTPPSDVDLYGVTVEFALSRGACVICDTTGESLIKCARHGVFLLKPNEHELRELFGEGDVIESAMKLCGMGAENVLLSLGEKGAVLLSENGSFRCKIPMQMPVYNTVGSGDSMLAGFVYAYKNGKSMSECLACAVSAGSCNAYTKPEKPFDRALFEELLKRSEVL